MRHGRGVRLVGWSVATAALLAMLVASGASGAAASRMVALQVKWAGSGTVRVTGNPAFTCRATVVTGNTCRHTFHVRRGRRIVVKALPLAGWKLTGWAGACKCTAATCSLRLKARRSVAVTFVPPGDRLNPYAVGKNGAIHDGWELRINATVPNANSIIEAVKISTATSLTSLRLQVRRTTW